MDPLLLEALRDVGITGSVGGLVLYGVTRMYAADAPIRRAMKSLLEAMDAAADDQTKQRARWASDRTSLERELEEVQRRIGAVRSMVGQLEFVARVWRSRALKLGWSANGDDQLPRIEDIMQRGKDDDTV